MAGDYKGFEGISVSMYVSMSQLTWFSIFMMFGHVGLSLLRCDCILKILWYLVSIKNSYSSIILSVVD